MRSDLSVILGIIFIVGCATAPYTGRNQFILVSEGQEASLGNEAGLAVAMGHEVAHALARDSAERMSQGMLLQLGGVGLGVAMGRNPAVASHVLPAYGTGVGVALPFGRSQETKADHIGLILMAKAGYDPRIALELWERMEKAGGKGAPPEFLTTPPGYETRIQQQRSFLPEALRDSPLSSAGVESLPLPESLDTASAKSERELLQRVAALNRYVEEPYGERAVSEALAYQLGINPQFDIQERQQLRLGYGAYAALRGVAYLGRSSLNRIAADYQRGRSWSELSTNNGSQINELMGWMGELLRTTSNVDRQLKGRQQASNTRLRPSPCGRFSPRRGGVFLRRADGSMSRSVSL